MKTLLAALMVLGVSQGCGKGSREYVVPAPTSNDGGTQGTGRYIPDVRFPVTPLPEGYYRCFRDFSTGEQYGCVWCPIDQISGIDCVGVGHLGHIGVSVG